MIILTDVDDVLLDWSGRFKTYVESKGFTIDMNDEHSHIGHRFGVHDDYVEDLINEFVLGDEIKSLDPIGDSQHFIPLLKEKGFEFMALTSISDESHVADNRMENLERIYGEHTFSLLTCLPTNSDKFEALTHFYQLFGKDIICWIDDKYKNVTDGYDIGIKDNILYHQSYNAGYKNNNIKRMNNWKEIYQYVSSKYKY